MSVTSHSVCATVTHLFHKYARDMKEKHSTKYVWVSINNPITLGDSVQMSGTSLPEIYVANTAV